MPAPHSDDLRVRTMQVHKTGSMRKTAEWLIGAPDTASKLSRHVKETRPIKSKKRGQPAGGGQPEHVDGLAGPLVGKDPDGTTEEPAAAADQALGCKVKRSMMHRILQDMEYTGK